MNHFLEYFLIVLFLNDATVLALKSKEDIPNLNYSYMNLYVGNLMKKQSFLLDTSIDMTTSICSPYSKITGLHQGNYYFADSNTLISCKDEKCLGNCDKNNLCIYDKINDSELQIESLITTQQVKLHIKDEKSIDILLGCTLKEDHFYYYNKADGVIGLANTKNSFLNTLFSSGKINNKIFSFCFTNTESKFTLDNTTTEIDAVFIPMVDKEFYSFIINSITVGSNNSYNAKIYPAYIHSGNPISYFPESLSNYIIYNIMNKTTEDFQDKIERNDIYGYCLLYDTIESLNEFTNSLLPNIQFYFSDNSYEYIWKPINYVYKVVDNSNKVIKACLGFSDSRSDKIIFGSNWMKDHQIIFDIDKAKIGFSEFMCGNNNTEETSTIEQSGINEQSHKDYQTLINQREEIQKSKVEKDERMKLEKKESNLYYIIIISILIVIVIILVIRICQLSKHNKTETKHESVSNEVVELESKTQIPSNPSNAISEYSNLKNTNAL